MNRMSENNVSVLISVYRKENPVFLSHAIDSIQKQTLPVAEIILVKDGPLSPELDKTINQYQNRFKNLKVIELLVNQGLGKALAHGLSFCNYELVARMDTDDIASPNRIQKQAEFMMSHPEVVVLGTQIYEFSQVPEDANRIKQVPESFSKVKKFAKLRNPINHPTVMFRKSKILAVGSYKDMPFFEDYYLWLRVLKKGYIIENLDEPLLYFRTGAMLERRRGASYFKYEYQFFKQILAEGLLSYSNVFLMILTRLPFRFLPSPLLVLLYKMLRLTGAKGKKISAQ